MRGMRDHRLPSLVTVALAVWLAPSHVHTQTRGFDVVSVKHAVPGTPGSRVRFLPGGRFVGENVAIQFVIQQAYGVRDYQIIAAPQWKAIIADGLNSRYQIEARGPESSTDAEMKEMVKTLLADRFQLRLHKETRPVPVYALVVADGGVRVARAPDGKGGGIELVAPGWIRGTGTAPGFLADSLSRYVNRPVVDRTNLKDVLDFDLTWTTLENADPDTPPGCHPSVLEMAKRPRYEKTKLSCPSIFTAVREQLGLRLDAQDAPTEVIVIDSIQLPTEN
jgi:uncharacterized protein (TIGR03435 family)